ncbi:MAG: DUF5074 domain-containing protein [Bacteroidota bacterium]
MIRSDLFGAPLLCLFVLITLSSCYNRQSEDEDPMLPSLSYESGVYIINQGSEQNTNNTGTISFYERENERTLASVFRTENPGRELGNRLQSMTVFNGRAYFVVTNTRRVEIATIDDFKYLGTITNLDRPKYFLPINSNKAYVSQWGADVTVGSIQVIDLTTNAILKEIPTRPGPEKMIRQGDFIYVCNTGGFLLDSVITKINVLTDEIVKTIEVGLSPHRIEIDRNEDLWVITRGFKNGLDEREGRLCLLQNDEVNLSLPVPAGAGNLVINQSKNRLFYTMQGGVYDHQINQSILSQAPFINFPYTTLGLDPVTNWLFASDAINFASNGQVTVYNSGGQEVNAFSVGVVPIEFWFQ